MNDLKNWPIDIWHEISVDPYLLSKLNVKKIEDVYSSSILDKEIKRRIINKLFRIAEKILTDKQLEIFILRYLLGLKESEICKYVNSELGKKIKNLSNKTIAKIYNRYNKKLTFDQCRQEVKTNKQKIIEKVKDKLRENNVSQPYISLVLKNINKKISLLDEVENIKKEIIEIIKKERLNKLD